MATWYGFMVLLGVLTGVTSAARLSLDDNEGTCTLSIVGAPDGSRLINSSCPLIAPGSVEEEFVNGLAVRLGTLEGHSRGGNLEERIARLEQENRMLTQRLDRALGANSSTLPPVPLGTSECDVRPSSASVLCRYMVASEFGFIAYKINYNTITPGYFDQSILEDACASIGAKPLCNNPSYCDSKGYRVADSYLSQCGLGAPRQCAGLRPDDLRHTIFWNTAGWNGNNMLAWAEGASDHSWYSPHTRSDFSDTFCAKPAIPCNRTSSLSTVRCERELTSSAGFKAYKINYNTNNPGYFDRGILVRACASIGAKPLCNNPNHCDGNGYAVAGAYLSQCGIGSAVQCAGLRGADLRDTIFWNTAGWNGNNFLGLAYTAADHSWYPFHTSSAFTETLCAIDPSAVPCDVTPSSSSVRCDEKLTPSTGGYVAYKINYNTNNPGYFDRAILEAACASIGAKPLCNNPSHCDGNGYAVAGAYLSQCGIGSAVQCAGLPPASLRHTIFWNTAGWNGNNFLGLANGATDHSWYPFHSPSSGYIETICARAS